MADESKEVRGFVIDDEEEDYDDGAPIAPGSNSPPPPGVDSEDDDDDDPPPDDDTPCPPAADSDDDDDTPPDDDDDDDEPPPDDDDDDTPPEYEEDEEDKPSSSSSDEEDDMCNGYSLIDACTQSYDLLVKMMVEKRCPLTPDPVTGEYPIHAAARFSLECLEALLLHPDIDLMVTDNEKCTPLHIACQNCDLEIASMLLAYVNRSGNDLDEEERKKRISEYASMQQLDGMTALHYAALSDNEDIVSLLIMYGVDVNLENEQGWTALHYAAANGSDMIAEELIMANADISAVDEEDRTPLHYACQFGHMSTVVKLLENMEEETLPKDLEGLSPLHLACLNDHVDILRTIIEGTPEWNLAIQDIDDPDSYGRTLLHAAAHAPSPRCFETLVEHSGSVRKRDENNRTILIWTVMQPPHSISHRKDVAECLSKLWRWWELDLQMAHGVTSEDDPMMVDNKGRSPLHYACYFNQIESIEFLINQTASAIHTADKLGRKPIHYCCSAESVHLLLQNGADVTVRDNNLALPVMIAASRAANAAVEVLLEEMEKTDTGIDATDCDRRNFFHYLAGSTLFHSAKQDGFSFSGITRSKAWYGDLFENCSSLVACVSRKAEHMLETQDARGRAPLHYASRQGNLALFKSLSEIVALMEMQYFLNLEDNKGKKPIHYAAIRGNLEIVEYILSCHVLANALDKSGLSPIHYAFAYNHIPVAQRMLAQNLANLQDSAGNPPFFYAVKHGYVDLMEATLKNMPELANQQDKFGNTPLHVAVSSTQTRCIPLLFSHGADTTICNSDGVTALHLAAITGDTSSMQVLLCNVNDVNILDCRGFTALHYAAMFGHANTVQHLIESNADLCQKEKKGGKSAMSLAALNGHLAIISLLQKASDALCWSADAKGRLPLHFAAYSGDSRIVQQLLEVSPDAKKYNANSQDRQGRSALHRAAAKGHTDLIKLLVEEKKAQVDLVDHDGISPLMLACYHQQLDAAKLLLDLGADRTLLDEMDRKVEEIARLGSETTGKTEVLPDIIKLLSDS